jgi:hypothetical protein
MDLARQERAADAAFCTAFQVIADCLVRGITPTAAEWSAEDKAIKKLAKARRKLLEADSHMPP